MKLTRLRLLGFKSFVEPTDFLIEPGLTGVVGPNGCGKSNLVEALRWVMGETSHKSLRAADMDDVIFSGTNNRPGRNNAEVAIQIDNRARKAPAQFNEHETLDVSRRIEREAGSTYRINGREVRARDVHILFADASTGSRSPSMVHQGRIGEIIQAKPEQRRRVLEEAAGISGLHARRHEAELRLRAAEHNLARLEDVITQLAGQIDALKRQARQAIRYRAVAERVRKAEATLFHLRWVAANAELAEAEQAKNAAVRLVAARSGEQAEASKHQTLAAAALPALREAEARAAAALQRLTMARETLDREETRATDRMSELDRRLVQLGDDIERERRLAADAQAALARLASEEEELQREVKANDERRAGADKRVTQADAVLAKSEKAADELTGTLADLTARRHALEHAAREHGERAARLADEIAAVEAALEQIEAKGRADLAPLAKAAEMTQTAVAEAEAATLRAEAAHSAARQALDVARGPLAEAERSGQRLDTEAKTLAKLLHVDAKKLWPPALDHVSVDKGYEAALGAALGDDLEAPIDPSAPMRWAGAAIDAADPALPDGVQALGDHVKAPKQLARRLAQIGVIKREQAARLAPMLKPGQRLVSREGDLWRWDGFSVAADAPAGAARRLAGKNRLADIEAELKAARREIESKQKAVTAAEAEVASAAEAEAVARTRWRALQHESQAAREQHAEAERAASRNAARLSALREAAARLTANRDEATTGRDEARRARRDRRPARATRRGARGSAGPGARSRDLRAATRRDRRRSRSLGRTQRRRGGADHDARSTRRGGKDRAREPQGCPAHLRTEAARAHRRDRNGASGTPRRRRSARRGRERARRGRPRRACRARSHGRGARGGRARGRAFRRRQAPARRRRPRDSRHARSRARRGRKPCRHRPQQGVARRRRGRSRSRTVAPRPRAARRRQSARRGRAARGRDPARLARDRARRPGRSDQAAAPGHPEPQPRSARAAARLLRDGEQPLQAPVHRAVRRRDRGAAADRARGPARGRPRNHRQAAGQEAGDAVAALRRRAGAHGACPHLRGVSHQPGADLRARRGRRATRRSQYRALLRPARRDDALDRHALRDHYPQSDHHGAHEPALRCHHGGARRLATRLGRPRGRGEAARGGLIYERASGLTSEPPNAAHSRAQRVVKGVHARP